MNTESIESWEVTRFPGKLTAAARIHKPRWRKRIGALPPDALQCFQRPRSALASNEVRVRVSAASLNFRDYAIALGLYAPDLNLPFVLGSDAVGRVEAIGSNVTRFRVGDRVISHFVIDWTDGAGDARSQANTLGVPLPGILQTEIVLPEHGFVHAPVSLNDLQASTLPIAGLTAWAALQSKARAKKGETLLVQGSGGVSLFGIQLGQALGLNVVATTSDEKKVRHLKALGADQVLVVEHGKDWSASVRDATGDGADIVLDVGGGSTIHSSVLSLRHGGRIVTIGFLGGGTLKLPLAPLNLKSASIHGQIAGSRKDFEDLCAFIDRTKLKPVIDSTFGFDDTPEAFDRLASGRQFGNVCIDFSQRNSRQSVSDASPASRDTNQDE